MSAALTLLLAGVGTAALLRAVDRVARGVDDRIGRGVRPAIGITALAVVAGAAGAVLWITAALSAGWRGPAFLGAEVVGTVTGEAAAGLVLVGGAAGARKRLACTVPPSWSVAVALGAAPVLLTVSWAYERLLQRFVAVTPQAALHTLLTLPPEAQTVGVIAIVAVAPLAEELLFRGAWFGRLQPMVGTRAAVLVTGLGFGLSHAGSPWTVPLLTALGVGLGALRAASGSVWPGVLVHAVNNGIAVAAVMAGDRLSRYV